MCPVSRCRRGLRRDLNGSALPTLPQSVSRGARFSRLHWFATATAFQVARPLDGSDRVSPATGGFYIQASDGLVALPAAGYDYNSTGLLCWRDFHPQEWQLASLHQIGEGIEGAGDRAFGGVRLGQGPRVGVVLERPAAIERQFIERVNGGGGDWASIIRVSQDGRGEQVIKHRGLRVREAATTAAFVATESRRGGGP